MRHAALAASFFASFLLAVATPALAARPHSTFERRPPVAHPVPAPVAPAAARGPVHLPPDLAKLALREIDDDEIAPDDRPESPLFQPRGEGAPRAARATAFGTNVRINTLLGTPPGNGESEVSMATLGNRMVAGWNDGQFWQVQPGFVGYGYSVDGGTTWTDGGSLPTLGASDVFYGDPVVVADPAGHWYFADLWRPSPTVTGITVTHGTFAGAAPVWGTPVVIATSPSDYLDKPWLAVDPASGVAYVAYIRFYSGGQRLEFARSTDHGLSWSVPVVLTATSSSPMSPRMQVGPGGELYLAYYAYSGLDGHEYLRIRRSLDQGLSFGAETAIGGRSFQNNYYSGPPGYNRERSVALVSIDVDRSGTPRRGRLHAVWQEGLNIDADPLGGGGTTAEIEPDESSAAATPFTVGQTLGGSLASTSDQDWWSFTGTAGQTFIAYLVPNASSCDGFLRFFAGGGTTSNRAAFSHFGGGVGLVEFTLPSTGTYWLRVLNYDGVASDIGAYVVYTGWHSPQPEDVARDHRDVLHSWSDDGGATWSFPRVVSDAAPRYDETWPEVAVDAAGRVHVAWYDHHDDPANGILTTQYYSRSIDGGLSFGLSQRFSTGSAINWSNVATNIFPNAGDYSALIADGMNVYANWADGRDGTPDSYFAKLVDGSVAVDPPAPSPAAAFALSGLRPVRGGSVRLLVSLADPGEVRLELFDLAGRRVASSSLSGTGAGQHVVELGEALPSGLFFARATQAGRQASTRVTALR